MTVHEHPTCWNFLNPFVLIRSPFNLTTRQHRLRSGSTGVQRELNSVGSVNRTELSSLDLQILEDGELVNNYTRRRSFPGTVTHSVERTWFSLRTSPESTVLSFTPMGTKRTTNTLLPGGVRGTLWKEPKDGSVLLRTGGNSDWRHKNIDRERNDQTLQSLVQRK